jgi:predicted RNA methylase
MRMRLALQTCQVSVMQKHVRIAIFTNIIAKTSTLIGCIIRL